MRSRWLVLFLVGICPMFPPALFGGGSGLNVVVVVNQANTNSVQLGNYYCERRLVPPQNVLRINWTGSAVEWTTSDFNAVLLNPLLAMLSDRRLTNQIDYVVLSMDIPYRVSQAGGTLTAGYNSTTSTLFYGFKPDYTITNASSCSLPASSFNSYAGSEAPFPTTHPATAATNSFLTMMLTAADLSLARQIVDQGVAADSSFPTQTVFLAKSTDRLRNVRYSLFDNTVFDSRFRPGFSVSRIDINSPDSVPIPMLGYQNGVQTFTVVPGAFVPGAMADNLTSYGGDIFENTGHTPLQAFLAGGASASYGTVVEPCNYLEKFPSPQVFFYQSRGFSIGECYYMGITNPYQGLLVGEPLAAPFAISPAGGWLNLPQNAVLAGTTNLALQCDAAAPGHPVQQVDLFVDGRFFKVLTNILPQPNNVLTVSINGYPTNYTVSTDATLASVAAGLVSKLSGNRYVNATKVRAFARGDRVELRSTDLSRPGAQTSLAVGSSVGSAPQLTTFLSSGGSAFLDSEARGILACTITNIPKVGDYLQLAVTKTNGQAVVIAVTNSISRTNLADFAKEFFDAINTSPSLQSADGLVVEDINMHEDFPYNLYIYGTNDHSGEFNIRARGAGWPASQITVAIQGSSSFKWTPSGSNLLAENMADLQPRQHLYLTAGLPAFPVAFSLDTSALADGFHDLTAVLYEGSHVRTQGRINQTVRIQNSTLSAYFALISGTSTPMLTDSARFTVTANNNHIARIELFSTGGLLTNVVGQISATFSVPGVWLGVGLHPVYAVVTTDSGQQYKTETLWIRFVTAQDAFPISIVSPLPTLSWPAVPGASYDILETTDLAASFTWRDTLTATSAVANWTDTNSAAPQRFYRIRTAN